MTLYNWDLARYEETIARSRAVEQARLLLGQQLSEQAALDGLLAELGYASNPDIARRWVNPMDPAYGAVVDGVTDNTAAVIAAGVDAKVDKRPLYLSAGAWVLDPGVFNDFLTGQGCKVYGDGVNATTITLTSEGYLFEGTLGGGSGIFGLHVTGGLLNITGGGADFRFFNNRVVATSSAPPIKMVADTCSASKWLCSTVFPVNAGDTVISVVPTGADSGSIPRHFSDIDLSSGCFEVGDARDLLLHNVFGRNLLMVGTSSTGVHQIGCKFASVGEATELTGVNTFAVGSTIAGAVTLGASFSNGVYGPNRDVSLAVHATALLAAAKNIIIHESLVAVPNADIIFAGGFKQTISGGTQDNVADTQTDVELAQTGGRWTAVTSGSILGLVIRGEANQVWTAGTLTVEVWKSVINTTTGARTETATGLTAVIDTTNRAVKVSTQVKDTDTFAAGDELFCKLTTSATWTPTTFDLKTFIQIES